MCKIYLLFYNTSKHPVCKSQYYLVLNPSCNDYFAPVFRRRNSQNTVTRADFVVFVMGVAAEHFS